MMPIKFRVGKDSEEKEKSPCHQSNDGRNQSAVSPGKAANYIGCEQNRYDRRDNARYGEHLAHVCIVHAGIGIDQLDLIFPDDFDQIDRDIVGEYDQGDAEQIF